MANGVEVQFTLRGRTRNMVVQTNRNSKVVAEQRTAVAAKLPRVTQVLALAIYFANILDRGEVKDYAELARLACVSRERISQIMKLRWLAPAIQQEILSSSPGCFSLCEAKLRNIAEEMRWSEQRKRWLQLKLDYT